MIIIFTQDETIIRNNPEEAKDILFSIYGKKLGSKAYSAVKKARYGDSYRENGGPLVRFVSKELAMEIQEKEVAIGMIK